ncbi:MAG: hypothetical protein R3C01_03445 [Planctomycetaceae bacterium]
MTRNSLALTSLVAAIPGGFMAYLLIMAFLSNPEKMPTMLNVVNGVALLVSVLLALGPIAILLFIRVKPSNEETAEAVGAGTGAAAIAAGGVGAAAAADWGNADEPFEMDDDNDPFASADGDDDVEAAAFEDDDFGADDDFGGDDLSAEAADDDAFEFDDDDELNFDDDDEFK